MWVNSQQQMLPKALNTPDSDSEDCLVHWWETE